MKTAFLPVAVAWPWTTVDVINHLWQSTVVALGVLLVLVVCRGLVAARTRRVLGWMALLKFALPAGLFVHAFGQIGAAPARWLGPEAAVTTLPAFIVTAAPGDAPARIPVVPLVAAVWLAGFCVLFISWVVRGLRLRRSILAEAQPVSSAMAQRIAVAAARAGFDEPPRCVAVGSEHGPGLLGFVSPIVILPRALEETLAPAELEAVLIHEFVHLQRRDNFWSAVQALFVGVFWFHPVVWVLNRRLGIETEQSCDERVLEITGDPDNYAGGLVKSVQYALGLAPSGYAGATTPPVVARIKNIFAHGARPNRPLARGVALAAGFSLLAFSGRAGSFAAAAAPLVPINRAAPEPSAPPSVGVPSAPAAPVVAATAASQPVAAANAAPASSSVAANGPSTPAEPAASETKIASPVAAVDQPVSVEPPQPQAQTKPEPLPAPTPPAAPAADVTTVPAASPTAAPDATTADAGSANPPAPAVPAAEERKFQGTRVYDPSELDRQPVPKFQARPQYPLGLRRAGVGGEAVVDFIVDPNGDVQKAYAIRSTHKEFAAAAVAAVSQWKFRPGRKGGQNLPTHMQVPIVFSLDAN